MLRFGYTLILLTFAQNLLAAEKFPLLNVFGDDQREDVTNKDAYPYAAIGKLDNDCTGTLIGRRLVLTAAHCVVDSSSGAARDDVAFFRINLLNDRGILSGIVAGGVGEGAGRQRLCRGFRAGRR